jgi:signal transduction histidine kinase
VGVAYREFTFELAAITDDAHHDEALQGRVLRLGQRHLGALGMTLGEVEPGDDPGSRIVAATGLAAWALGRRVSPGVVAATVRRGPAPYRMELNVLEPLVRQQLEALGIGWVLVHPIEVHGRPAVVLGAFMEPGAEVGADETAVIKLLAAAIGYSYRTQPPRFADSRLRPDSDERELFMAVISHELRTGVTVIKGYAETLRDHWDKLTDYQRRESVAVIGQRAKELARMVDRLLDASTTADALSVERAPFDLLDTLHKAAAELPSYLRKRLQLELPPRLPAALGHRGGIAGVLTELVTNAHKYSPGQAPVVLSADSDRCTVLFQVSDRGIGIPADRASHTFERFWQGEVGDDRRYGGAGLGLFLVRKTIERQNGWVSLRPRDGGGTVAEVRLPRGDIDVGEA